MRKNSAACSTVRLQTSQMFLPLILNCWASMRSRAPPQVGAHRISAIAAQKYAHMQLVLLPLQMIEKSADTGKFAFAINDQFLVLRVEFRPGNVERNLCLLRIALQFGEQWSILRLRPRLDRTIVQCLRLVGNHQIKIEINRIAKALAARTRAVWIIE